MSLSPKQKLYCYVDETGQDTEGDFFLVAIVILESQREELRQQLIKIERASGKLARKWMRASQKQREEYIKSVIELPAFTYTLYYEIHRNTRSYTDLTMASISKAINMHASRPYTATILVDGLRRTEQQRFTQGLRRLNVKVRKVRGANDRNDALIRLADAFAGFVRDARLGNAALASLYAKAAKENIIRQI
jgi:ribonuclease HII